MTEPLRWDHDRMVGESHRDYAIRQRGVARAAEMDRDSAHAEVERLRSRMDEGASAAFKCPDGLHPTWLLDPEVECPWCEVARLRSAIRRVQDLCENPSAWAYTDGPSAEDVVKALDEKEPT